MPIYPLPQFETDLAEREAELELERAKQAAPPTTMVVRFGSMKMIGEFPYKGDVRPGCGSKIVIETFRGLEIGEMLTSTCPNAGCSKSVTRKEMLEYIENSGGRDYPFSTRGSALRVASGEDMHSQERIEQSRHGLKLRARDVANQMRLPIKIVDVEPILGGESTTVYYTSEDRIDTGALARELASVLEGAIGRVECKHVGARDEARLTADYERCGEYCCCKNFLKVLKPVSMRSAKVQKATLDPLKISGRCGRLMCCLRYEDQTYEDLRKRLPNRKKRVGTPEGDGIVVSSQILTQLVLVELDNRRRVAVPVEELTEPTGEKSKEPARSSRQDSRRSGDAKGTGSDSKRAAAGEKARSRRDSEPREARRQRDDEIPSLEDLAGDDLGAPSPSKKKRRRKRKKTGDGASEQRNQSGHAPKNDAEQGDPGAPKKKRRRRRRKPKSDGEGGGGATNRDPEGGGNDG